MKHNFYKILFISLFIPTVSYSQSGGSAKFFMLEFNSLFGWGGAKTATDATTPSIGTFNLGIGLGVNIKKVTLGLSYDYRMLTQFSDVDATVGNRRGTFISPTSLLFRINFEKIKIGILLINNGTYNLMNITANGKKVVYTNPSGFRFDFIFRKMNKFTPVIFFESVTFSGMNLDGIPSALTSNLIYSSYGAGLKYDF